VHQVRTVPGYVPGLQRASLGEVHAQRQSAACEILQPRDLELSDPVRDIFAKCLLCGACNVTCPSGVDLKKVFLGMREEIAERRGFTPWWQLR